MSTTSDPQPAAPDVTRGLAGAMPSDPAAAASGRKLGREDWAVAALFVAAESGLGAVAVEPLARRLGVTKGSFYWHFANRGELIAAALAYFEDVGTTGVIAHLDTLPGPRERLEAVMHLAFSEEAGGRLLVALAASDDPAVRESLARVTARRVDYLEALLLELGQPADVARRGAVRAYAEYVGLYYVAAVSPAHAVSEDDRGRMVDDLLRSLLG